MSKANRMPSSMNLIVFALNSAVLSRRNCLSSVSICDTFATEAFGKPVCLVVSNKLPGASVSRIFELSAKTITVGIRLWLNEFACKTKTGRAYPGSDAFGSGRSTHHISPRFTIDPFVMTWTVARSRCLQLHCYQCCCHITYQAILSLGHRYYDPGNR